MNTLYNTLGLKSRYGLAMESEEDLANATSISNTSVVLTGPLADAYTTALDQIFAKDAQGAPIEGGDPSVEVEPTGETGTNVVAGEDAPQPGQEIEADEAGKTTEVEPIEGQVESAGSTDVVEDGDEPLNKEEITEEEEEALKVATEGLGGAVCGFVGGIFGWGVTGAILSVGAKERKLELEHLTKELEKAINDNGKEAIKSGKISSADFSKHYKVGARTLLKGFVFGTFPGPFYSAFKGSEVENLTKEIQRKCDALDDILEKANNNKDGGKTNVAVESIVMESQAQDAVLLQSLHSSIVPEEPSDEEFETVYAVDQTKVGADDVIEVTELLKNSEDPEKVTVLIDSEVASGEDVANVTPPESNGDTRPLTPEGDVPEVAGEEGKTDEDKTEDGDATEGDADEDKPEPSPLAASLESIVLSMGGKVVHSFAEYVATRRR